MFVTASDFDLVPYSIPNLDRVENTFADYINQTEESILIKLLGRPLYLEFIAGLEEFTTYRATVETVIGDSYAYGNDVWEALTETTGTLPIEGADWTLIEQDNKWLKLKNGANYTLNSEVFYWDGMVKLLKPYIYCNWLNDTFDNYSGNGVSQSTQENATVISPRKRIVDSFNNFSLMAGTWVKCPYYSSFYPVDYYDFYFYGYEDIEQRNTLYGFLTVNSTYYTGFRFQEQGIKNVFNI
jgi:hypothetical protein